MKTCPACAEEVKQEAKVCRYCRHKFIPWDEIPKERQESIQRKAEAVAIAVGLTIAAAFLVAML